MKAWALKSPYDGHLIEVHGDEGRAVRSAVMHRIENGMDVKVVEVECDEMKNNERIVRLKEILKELSDEMKETEQITRLKKLLVVFKEEKERHLKEATHFSGTKAAVYHLGSADVLEDVIKQIEDILH